MEKCSESCECTKEDNCGCVEDNCNCDPCECTEEDNCGCMEEVITIEDDNKGKKKKDLKNKVLELENELLKSKADFINYRKRLEDEHAKYLKYCNEGIIKAILPNLDNFERAINMDDTNLEDEVSKFLSGFKMIYCNLNQILKDNGVVVIDGNNKPFDPSYHEAIMTEVREGVEAGMVLDVLQKGYILKGKVIRPAMVRVSE